MVRKAAWYLFAAMVALAVWRMLPQEGDTAYAWGERANDRAETFITDLVDTVFGDSDNPQIPGTIPTAPTAPDGTGTQPPAPSGEKDSTTGLITASEPTIAYNRDEWRHWDNITACWTVREEVLVRDAEPGSITMLDSRGIRTSDKSKACDVAGGVWVDPYTNTTFTNPADLDIDHMVALKEAAESGGQTWSSERKRDYANNLGYSWHLVAVSASANRSKADKDPAQWKPVNTAIHCRYAQSWIDVKRTWNLTADSAEQAALRAMLGTCGG